MVFLLRVRSCALVRVASSAKFEALLVADRAIGSDQGQNYVYAIDSKNVVPMRRITTGQIVDGLRVVKSGLNADDVVLINGTLKARPGNPVKPNQGQYGAIHLERHVSIGEHSERKPFAGRNQPRPKSGISEDLASNEAFSFLYRSSDLRDSRFNRYRVVGRYRLFYAAGRAVS